MVFPPPWSTKPLEWAKGGSPLPRGLEGRWEVFVGLPTLGPTKPVEWVQRQATVGLVPPFWCNSVYGRHSMGWDWGVGEVPATEGSHFEFFQGVPWGGKCNVLHAEGWEELYVCVTALPNRWKGGSNKLASLCVRRNTGALSGRCSRGVLTLRGLDRLDQE